MSSVQWLGGLDPWEHLAREELLLEEAELPVLVLYINSPCVVMGKHQNPLREVRLDEAARRGVPLVRRASGGGTVWHDEGNLNWSLLLPKAGYDRAAVTRQVAEALSPLGLTLDCGEKGDLFLAGKKVSGAAYLHRRDRVLHHGTLLCRARLDELHGVLGPTGTLREWVGVASRPMAVTNLEVDPSVAAQALIREFLDAEGPVGTGQGAEAFETKVTARARELASLEWLWDQTPPFHWEGQTRLGVLRARVKDGRILEAWDDRSLNMSKIAGNYFFDHDLFEYIFPREAL